MIDSQIDQMYQMSKTDTTADFIRPSDLKTSLDKINETLLRIERSEATSFRQSRSPFYFQRSNKPTPEIEKLTKLIDKNNKLTFESNRSIISLINILRPETDMARRDMLLGLNKIHKTLSETSEDNAEALNDLGSRIDKSLKRTSQEIGKEISKIDVNDETDIIPVATGGKGFFSKMIGTMSLFKIGDMISKIGDKADEIDKKLGDATKNVQLNLGLTRAEAYKTYIEFLEMSKGLAHQMSKNPFLGYKISIDEYSEALSKAADTGIKNIDQLKDMAEIIAINSKVMPTVDFASLEMFQDVISGYEDGAQRMKQISGLIVKYSQNFWVKPETLTQIGNKYHWFVKSISKNSDDYVKYLNKMLKTTIGLDEAFLDSEQLIDRLMEFGFTPLTDDMTQWYTQFGMLGLSVPQMRKYIQSGEMDKAMSIYVDAIRSRFGKYYQDGKFNVSEQFLAEARLMGLEPKEIMQIVSGRGTDAIEAMQEASKVGDNLANSMDKGIQSLIDALRDNVFVSYKDQLKNMYDISLQTLPVLKDINQKLDDLDMDIFDLIGAVVEAIAVISGIKALFSGGSTVFNWIKDLFGKGGTPNATSIPTGSSGSPSSPSPTVTPTNSTPKTGGKISPAVVGIAKGLGIAAIATYLATLKGDEWKDMSDMVKESSWYQKFENVKQYDTQVLNELLSQLDMTDKYKEAFQTAYEKYKPGFPKNLLFGTDYAKVTREALDTLFPGAGVIYDQVKKEETWKTPTVHFETDPVVGAGEALRRWVLQQSGEEHASGLDKVPYDLYPALLHKGEMVIPAKQANFIRLLMGEKTTVPSTATGPINSSNRLVNSIPKFASGVDYVGDTSNYRSIVSYITAALKEGTVKSLKDVVSLYKTGITSGLDSLRSKLGYSIIPVSTAGMSNVSTDTFSTINNSTGSSGGWPYSRDLSNLTGDKDANPILMGRLSYFVRDRHQTGHIVSGYRSIAQQQRLWDNRKKEHPGEPDSITKRWVCVPGTSPHNYGLALDVGGWLRNVSSDEYQKYGLYKPVSWENWHIEPLETKGKRFKWSDIDIRDYNLLTKVPGYESGTIAFRRHIAEVAENGPESIIPLTRHRDRAVDLWKKTGMHLGYTPVVNYDKSNGDLDKNTLPENEVNVTADLDLEEVVRILETLTEVVTSKLGELISVTKKGQTSQSLPQRVAETRPSSQSTSIKNFI